MENMILRLKMAKFFRLAQGNQLTLPVGNNWTSNNVSFPRPECEITRPTFHFSAFSPNLDIFDRVVFGRGIGVVLTKHAMFFQFF